MKTYFVYILKCSDDTLYTGITNNIDRRIAEHKSGFDIKSYTYSRRPLKLLYCCNYSDVNQAIAAEKMIKGWSRRKKIALIEKDWIKLIEYSKAKKKKYWLSQ